MRASRRFSFSPLLGFSALLAVIGVSAAITPILSAVAEESPSSIVDDGDTGFSLVGMWKAYGAGRGKDQFYIHNTSPAGTASWRFENLPSGIYRVSATWPGANASVRSTNAPFTVLDDFQNILATKTVNQIVEPNDFSDRGSAWEEIGTVDVTDGVVEVRLTNVGADNYVIADAVHVQRVGDVATGNPEIVVTSGTFAIEHQHGNLDFGNTEVGSLARRTLTIRNAGNDVLIVGEPAVSAGYAFGSLLPATMLIAPAQAVSIDVVLQAASAGTNNGMLTFSTNDGDEPVFAIALNGTVFEAGELPIVRIVDDGDSDFATTGMWKTYGAGRGNDQLYIHNTAAPASAIWSFPNITPGQYRVSASWPSADASLRATNAQFFVRTSAGEAPLLSTQMDLSKVQDDRLAEGSAWEDLGIVTIANNQILVELTNLGANSYVIADAVRIERVGPAANTGNLYVGHNESLPSHQLLGGTVGDSVLELSFHAQDSSIAVTHLQLSTWDSRGTSINRLELFKSGELMPFAYATVASCGNDAVPVTNPANGRSITTFCANMQPQLLTVEKDQTITVAVKPRMRTDADGAFSGESIRLWVSGRDGAVRARSMNTGMDLAVNNGNAIAEGEIMIGTSGGADPNLDLVGRPNVTVLSKITSIVNASADADGTVLPMGIAPIGEFRMTAAPHLNTRNGLNQAVLSDLIFRVALSNVALDGTSFAIYNQAESGSRVPCSLIGAATTSGVIVVHCANLMASDIDVALAAGESATFVLDAFVQSPQIAEAPSSLQVFLDSFTDPTATSIGSFESHIQWRDVDYGASSTLMWVGHSAPTVRSTRYGR